MSLDQYRLTRSLGSGRFGERFEAICDAEAAPIEAWILDPSRVPGDAWANACRRWRLAALLNHPGANRLIELGHESPTPFLCRRRLPQTTLAEYLAASSTVSVPEVVRISLALAEVLAAAHGLGLPHGDLSPMTTRLENGDPVLDFTGLDSDSVAPESPEGDLLAFGQVIQRMLAGRRGAEAVTTPMPALDSAHGPAWGELDRLARELQADDPLERPAASDVAQRLRPLAPTAANLGTTLIQGPDASSDSRSCDARSVPARLGRFRILDLLGEGGMGKVFRAEDLSDGSTVAVKLLKPELACNPTSLRRFSKEARMLAAVRNPYVANLLEVNQQSGVHYLAMEFVAGQSVRSALDARGHLSETEALDIIADVCRALASAHGRGIVHRDIKPENILLVKSDAEERRVKLTDFGLARQTDQSESLNLTQESVVGTPLYMAPEQGYGRGNIDARTDVYALGATLFHLLTGRPPFLADSPLGVLMKHANDAPPQVRDLTPATSEHVGAIVARCLAKQPGDRYPDAAALLDEIERLQRGEAASLAIHPRLPAADPSRILHFDFVWELASSPEQLWPHVSNTERLNRAIGLPQGNFTSRWDGFRLRRFGRIRKAGFVSTWEEHPFEWIEGRRFGVLRVVDRGPFEWLASIVEMSPRAGGGTTLTHRFRILPRGWLGRVFANVEVGGRSRRALDRVYRRIDDTLTGRVHGRVVDSFEDPATLTSRSRQRVTQGVERLIELGIVPRIAELLGEYVEKCPPQAAARMRPLAVAEQLGLDPMAFVNACLRAAGEGLLVLLWDILCPVCRIPSQIEDTMRKIRSHGSCEACRLDFELDFANSVEMIFRVHPEIRPVELGVFCVGGPAHSPHVAAQVRVACGERFDLVLELTEGAYRLRSPQLPHGVDFRVVPWARSGGWELLLSRRPPTELAREIRPGSQRFVLVNDTLNEIVVRVERTAPRGDAFTAARAMTLPLFRELFPGETLAQGQLVAVAHAAFLVVEAADPVGLYRGRSDAQAFAQLTELFQALEAVVRREGGTVVKTLPAGALAVFHESAPAVRAALALPPSATAGIRCGIHRGSAMSATINDRLDYFGAAVNLAYALPSAGEPGDLVVTRAVTADPESLAALKANAGEPVVLSSATTVPGEPVLFRYRLLNAI